MAELTLVMGNRNYSSWSLRAWLALRMSGLPFDEIVIPLDLPDSKRRMLEHSPTGRVPVLHHGDLAVWDSLAICEYAAELAPNAGLWPESRQARAAARAASAEMHAGFEALRAALPMNIRAEGRNIPLDGAVLQEIDRICEIWRQCRQAFGEGGPFLFGEFSIADAMYAPVTSRFRTYGIPLDGTARDYADVVLSLPAMQEWMAAARAESWIIEAEEVGRPAL